jgi:nucleotide-binding universal stress UspA family protein
MSLHTAKLKQVLVAVDLSTTGERAMNRALQLAASHGAELTIVHIMEEGLPLEAQALVTAKDEDAIRDRLAANPLAEQIKITVNMVVGRPETDIVERAVMTNANCIVLGLHDRLLAENRAIQGTLTEAVIGGTKLPVLLVQGEAQGPYRSATVGIDLTPLAVYALKAALLVAPHAALQLVHAYAADSLSLENTPTDLVRRVKSFAAAEKELLDRAAAGAGLEEIALRTAAVEGDPREVLKMKVEKYASDLLVLATHGRTGLRRSLLGSVTTDLINERLCDILVIRPQ